MVILFKVKVILFTNSAVTIAGFARINDLMHLSVCKKEKIPNFQIWMMLAYVLKVMNLKVKLVKVKAHSKD